MQTKSQSYVMFTYSIEHLLQKDKVLFYYALKGRDGKGGMLNHKLVIQLGRAVLLVPKALELDFTEFLDKWKCEFKKREIIIEKTMEKDS